jgi:hypothetical protein
MAHGQPTPAPSPRARPLCAGAVRPNVPVGPAGPGHGFGGGARAHGAEAGAQGVADKWVLQAMNAVERHRFVDRRW